MLRSAAIHPQRRVDSAVDKFLPKYSAEATRNYHFLANGPQSLVAKSGHPMC